MQLAEVIRKVRGSVVAFGSRLVQSPTATPPGFPAIIGTGFVVDQRGLIITNQHVIDAMGSVTPSARFVMVFPEPITVGGDIQAQVLMRTILAVSSISHFASGGPFFGQSQPDFGFVHIDLQGLPSLEINTDPQSIESGVEVATVGFPKGETPLTPFDYSRASQVAAFARRGIISSVLPCECPEPHGFSVDIQSEGGASGSPIILSHEPRAIGLLHAGFDGAPITYGIPGHLLKAGLAEALKSWNPNLQAIPSLQSVVEATRQQHLGGELNWSIVSVPVGNPGSGVIPSNS